MSGQLPSYEKLAAENAQLKRVIVELMDRIAELERRLAADSSNSSRPPSQDAPWVKKAANKRPARPGSGRRPGKQSRGSVSRSLVDDADDVVEIVPERCAGCERSLADAAVTTQERRQVVGVPPAPGADGQRVPVGVQAVFGLPHHPARRVFTAPPSGMKSP